MKKGKFGIVLCFYPIAAFAAVILSNPILVCLALAAAAVFIEKDEWAGRQTLQACMASVTVFFFSQLSNLAQMSPYIPFLSSLMQVVATALYVVVYLAAIIFSVLAIIRVCKDEESNFPLFSEFAYRIYGKRKPKPNPVAPPMPQQYTMPYGGMPQQNPVPQNPVQMPQQPYPPQNVYPAANAYVAIPYAPPTAAQPPYQAPQEAPQPPMQQPQQDEPKP